MTEQKTTIAAAVNATFADRAIEILGNIKGQEQALAQVFADCLEDWSNGNSADNLRDFCEAIRTSGDEYIVAPVNSVLRKLGMKLSITACVVSKPTSHMAGKAKTYANLIRANAHFFDYRVKEKNPPKAVELYEGKTAEELMGLAMQQAYKWIEREQKRLKGISAECPALKVLDNARAEIDRLTKKAK